jgi:hypothetical protein
MAGKYSIYKYVKLAGKGWRYARAVYHPNGKIKPVSGELLFRP